MSPLDAGRLLLACSCLTPFGVFFAFSVLTKIQPNWPLLAWPGGIVLLVDWLGEKLGSPCRGTRRWARGAALAGGIWGLALVALAHDTSPLLGLLAKLSADAPAWEVAPVARYDPTARLKGWSELGAAVGAVLAEEHAAGRRPFVLTDDYQLASMVRFYCPGNPPTYSAQVVLGGRRSQYDIWENPLRERARFVGRPVIYIGSLVPPLVEHEGRAGALRTPELARRVEHFERGHRLAAWAIWRSPEFLGFDVEIGEKY